MVVAGTAAALIVLGVPPRDLSPSGWDRLFAGIDLGLRGLGGTFEYPFAGAGEWARLLLVVPVVPLLIAAAVFSFRPGRDSSRPPIAGLVLLIAAFAIPATARPTAAPLLWGAVLLLLAAAWLWGERVRRGPALVLIAGFAAVAIPVTTSLAGDEPPIDYRGWSVPGTSAGVSFDWDQTYGPIDWPRTGEPLFRVHTDRANYWRAEVLDEFYGDVWRRSGGGGGPVPATPSDAQPFTHPDRDWSQQARFEILALESPIVISPGQAQRVQGLANTETAPDGTTRSDDEPLAPGTRYSVLAYAPNPRPELLRSHSRRYRPPLAPYSSLALPVNASLEATLAPTHISVPLWGTERGRAQARRMLAASAYSQVAHLAERLTAGERNAYDAAVAIESHLRTSYAYNEQPPRHRLPLRAFLFQDGIGYCQQFSGAMALMLRMVGIPARVAAGFAPGTPLTSGKGFVVTDLDAHAWVEVYFNGIGWVPFDPTPPTAPAQGPEVRGAASFALGAGALGELRRGRSGHDRTKASGTAPAVAEDRGGAGSLFPFSPLIVLAAITALALIAPVRAIRHRRLPPALAEEREIAELRAALAATGLSWDVSTTLLVAEDRLRFVSLDAAAAYVHRLRRRRYSADDIEPPTPAERRSTRRDLAALGGLSRRVRMLLLMPPGGPRRVRPRHRVRGQRAAAGFEPLDVGGVEALLVAQRARRVEHFAGLQQRLQAGQDHHPAAVELVVGAVAELVVGDGQPARVADRLDLPGHPGGTFRLDLVAPQRGHRLHEAAGRVDLEVLALADRHARDRVPGVVGGAGGPVRLDSDPEVVLLSQLALGDRLPQPLRRGLDVDLEHLFHVIPPVGP